MVDDMAQSRGEIVGVALDESSIPEGFLVVERQQESKNREAASSSINQPRNRSPFTYNKPA